MIRYTNNNRVYEMTAKSIISDDYPELITLVTITEDGKDFTAYRSENTPHEVYEKYRKLLEFEGYIETID